MDLALGVAVTVLEFRHWGEDGFTPDVVVAYTALPAQLLLVAAYLVLARDAGIRGLWKSAAGMLGSYLLFCLLELVMLEMLSATANAAILITTGLGILGLLIFSISGFPHFQDSGRVMESPPPASRRDSSAGMSWIGFGVAVVTYLVLKAIIRGVMRRFPGIGFGADDWAVIEFFVLIVFAFSFAVWFAITKIRHRARLGGMAAVVGGAEILILLAHAGLGALILAVLITEAANNPQLDDAGVDRLLTPWMKGGSLLSLGCHVIWALLTVAFFTSLRNRAAEKWPEADALRITT